MFRSLIGPLFLMSVPPFFVFFVWAACAQFGGSIGAAAAAVKADPMAMFPSWDEVAIGAKMCSMFALVELVLLLVLPHEKFLGAVSEKGTRAEYRINGVSAYVVSMLAYVALSLGLNVFPGGIVYDHYGGILGALSIFAPIFCIFLYFKGIFFPSTPDCEPTGNLVVDLYWGIELYPSIPILNVSMKQMVNCRFAMMGWNVVILSFMLKQLELYGEISYSMMVSFALQSLYIFKFFVWERGYFNSIDIMHDKFGFYICWGCLVYLPGTYTLTSLFLTEHPVQLSEFVAAAILGSGAFSVWANFNADDQRLRFRESNGKEKVWGKKPTYITASYRTTDGRRRTSLLLTSGWWGVARHFNYVFELMLTVSWTIVAGFDFPLPWFYTAYLTILLCDRAVRDDERCHLKYGKDFEKYCAHVPYRMIPHAW